MSMYMPGFPDVVEAMLSLFVFASWSIVGAAVRGRSGRSEFDPLVGWAVLCLPFVLAGTLTTLSFAWIDLVCVAIVAAAAFECYRRRIDLDLKGWLPYFVLALPFLVMVTPTQVYGWDAISHWLPNAQYIIANQHFPREGLPPANSMHPGYPYGFALAVCWVEQLSQAIHVQIGIVGIPATENVLLFAVAARMLAGRVRSIHPADPAAKQATLGTILFSENAWLAAGLSFLLVTALSPGFLPSNSLSANADNPTSIALLAVALALLPAGSSEAEENRVRFVQLPLILVLLAFLKEDNVVPVVAMLAGRVVWDVRTSQQPVSTLRNLVLAGVPMLAVAALWHTYAYLHIPSGEMSLRAPSQWNFALLPHAMLSMAGILVKKTGYFAMLVPVMYLAGRNLVRGERSPANAISVIAAAGFVGYTLFLAFAYVSIFSEREAERAAAFWRYQSHLALVLEAALVLPLSGLVVRRRLLFGRLAGPLCAVMLAAPIVMAPVIRPDTDPLYRSLRSIGGELNALIGGAHEMAVVDQHGAGWPCPIFVYEAKTPLRLAECVTKISPCPACEIRKATAETDTIWTNGWSAELAAATRLSLPPNRAYLLKRSAGTWAAVATWPMAPDKTWGVRAIWQTY